MSNYYESVIFNIKNHIENDEIKEAKALLNEELKMPYIPNEYENELQRLNQIVESLLKLNEESKQITITQIEKYLNGNDQEQLQAVAVLLDKNLRSHIDLIQNYLCKNPNKEAASLLIDALIEQNISNEFTYICDGIEFNFIPTYLIKPYESDGFLKADNLLQKWISNDNPTMYELCLQMLIHQTYLYLPLSYEEDEGESLALSIAKKVMELLGEDEFYEQLINDYSLNSIKLFEIKS